MTNNQLNSWLQQALTSLREYYEPKIIIGQKITVEDREQIKAILAISDASFQDLDQEFIIYGLLKVCFDLPNALTRNSSFEQNLKDWQDKILIKLKEDENILLENFRESEDIEYGFLLNYCLASGLIQFLSTEANVNITLAAALIFDVVHNSWYCSPTIYNKWFINISTYLKEYMDAQILLDWKIPNLIEKVENWPNLSKFSPLPKDTDELELSTFVAPTNEVQNEIKKISQSGKKLTDNISNITDYLNYDQLEKKLLWWLNVKHSKNYNSMQLTSYREIKNSNVAGLYMGLDLVQILGTNNIPVPKKVYALLIECLYLTHPNESQLNTNWIDLLNDSDIKKFTDIHLSSLWKIIEPFSPLNIKDKEENSSLKSQKIICEFFKLTQAQYLLK
ncbi:GTPase-associated system all-helical protein GASH [Acinetobacter pittii]|uniref:GTPase-associated system all-helical protein GASH n=1 Tax=Acinetobacter pittii TaxID=48296 RepID=UPI00192C0E5F|nr:GTPase-associated system all-helical protein GASH [Acinetobacter pittii]